MNMNGPLKKEYEWSIMVFLFNLHVWHGLLVNKMYNIMFTTNLIWVECLYQKYPVEWFFLGHWMNYLKITFGY